MMNDWNLQKEETSEDWKDALHREIITALSGSALQKSQAISNVGYYYQCCAPAHLYKYYKATPMNLNAIMNNQMWYSAPCNFNDVFDCDIYIDKEKVLQSLLKSLGTNSRVIRRGSSEWLNQMKNMRKFQAELDSLKETTGISCLSEKEDSLLMWAHYADNHRGICVKYELLEINNQLGFSPIPVIYSSDKICVDSLNINSIEQDTYKLLIESTTSKSPEWQYEKEWRIIQDNKACGDRWEEKKGALLDMIRPTSIILGCKSESETQNVLEKYCRDKHVNLYRMEKNDRHYGLTPKPVLEFDSE